MTKLIKNKESIIYNIKKYFGVLIILAGLISFGFSIYFDAENNIIAFLACLLGGFWAFIYGMFVIITKKPIYSLYYPSTSLFLISFPPLITAWITRGYADTSQEWIQILTTCLTTVLGITLFGIFMYYTYTRPQKRRREFINANISKYRHIKELEDDYIAILKNKKNDIAKIENWVRNKHKVKIEKWVEDDSGKGTYIQIQLDAFVEYHNAYFFAVKSLVELSDENDDRTIAEFEEDIQNKFELSQFLFGFNELLKNNGFKETFIMEEVSDAFGIENKLVLNHLIDTEKSIEFIFDGECILFYLDTHIHFFSNNIETMIKEMFVYIKDILTDKIVAYVKKSKRGFVLWAITYDLNNYNSFKKLTKYKLIKSNNINSWSGRQVAEILHI